MIDPDQWFEENEANPKFNVRDDYGNFVRFEVQPMLRAFAKAVREDSEATVTVRVVDGKLKQLAEQVRHLQAVVGTLVRKLDAAALPDGRS